jgi:Family of unknown function (DUF6496)
MKFKKDFNSTVTKQLIKSQIIREIESYLVFIGSMYDKDLLFHAMQAFINKRRGKAIMKSSKKADKKPEKVKKVIKEFKEGTLHSGSKKGPVVSNPKQAIAIALSEQRKAKRA